MPIEAEDLARVTQDIQMDDGYYGGRASTFLILLIIGSVLSTAVVGFFGVMFGAAGGAVVGIIVNLAVAYYLIKKLFASIDRMIKNRISRREKELIEALDVVESESEQV